MADLGPRESRYGLAQHGIAHTGDVYWNLTTAQLYEEAVKRSEGVVAHGGPLVVETGMHTGRSPKDRYVVDEPNTTSNVDWGSVNVPISQDHFDQLYGKALAYLQHKELFVQDLLVGADPRYQRKVRFINELAWHNLFVRSLFLRPEADELPGFEPEVTVIHVPNLHADPAKDHVRTETFILVDLHGKRVLIGGTGYAGEQKKSIFGFANYLLPLEGVLTMHCSANYGQDGDCALFFGLSGTGKTTLSADPDRTLIGDDEHAWSNDGVFNLEGGCYAKVIKLSEEAEPQIWSATHHFNTVLENVVVDPDTRELDLDDDSLTENTRAAYPLTSIPGCDLTGMCAHPKNIVFLTCDAFGVLPPVSKLTPAQAMYYFLNGYTARVAGAEKGVTEPEATFSACFGSPFLPLKATVYADMLGEKIAEHGSAVWLINTGWSGGPAGKADRMKIAFTRAMVKAALSGELEQGEFRPDPVFGVAIPTKVAGVPDNVLDPRQSWEDKAAYDAQARKLAAMFRENFKQFSSECSNDVRACEPKID